MLHDDLGGYSTHLEDEWRGEMWGTWATDERAKGDEPFEIPAMGMGCFSCRREAWVGFNPRLRGFGAEEMISHIRFRRAGRKCLCLPWLKWVHRFNRPNGVSYSLKAWDKCRNYVLSLTELGMPLDPVYDAFVKAGLVSEAEWKMLTETPHDPPETIYDAKRRASAVELNRKICEGCEHFEGADNSTLPIVRCAKQCKSCAIKGRVLLHAQCPEKKW
jgi:hypothetical protein